jgi:ATP-dependent exoDNAse (exonuclease V) alpha subunit
VRSNPYALAKDIYGIGFMTADQIAQRSGFQRTQSIVPKQASTTPC